MSLKITSLDPAAVEVGWEGSLAINGQDLGKPGFVSIEGAEQKVEAWSVRQIKVTVTKPVTAKAGKKRLVVHDENGNLDETQWSVEP